MRIVPVSMLTSYIFVPDSGASRRENFQTGMSFYPDSGFSTQLAVCVSNLLEFFPLWGHGRSSAYAMLADPSQSGKSAEHRKNTNAEKDTEAQKEREAEPASRHRLNYSALGPETWLTHPALTPGNWFHRCDAMRSMTAGLQCAGI